MRSCRLLLISLFTAFSIAAQNGRMTFEQAYFDAAPVLLQELPTILAWQDDDHFLLNWDNAWILIGASTGKEEIVARLEDFTQVLPPGVSLEDYEDETDFYQQLLFLHHGDLFLLNRAAREWRQLTETGEEERNPEFSPNGDWVAFTRGNDLYALEIASGRIVQLTHDGSRRVYNGRSSWVYHEEVFGRRANYKAFWWSPDSRKIAFMRFDDTLVPDFTLFNADGVHGSLEVTPYPKPGDPLPRVKVGVADIATSRTVWTDDGEVTDDYLAWPRWSRDSRTLYYQWMNRGQNHLKLKAVDVKTGVSQVIFEETQPAWVEFWEGGDLAILPNQKGFIVRSDRDGWRHLYHLSNEGKMLGQLTRGSWAVNSILGVDEARDEVYFDARKEASTETHLYRISLEGADLTRLTRETGSHDCELSPGFSWFADEFSELNTPTKMQLCNRQGRPCRLLGNEATDAFHAIRLGKRELFHLSVDDEYALPAVWTLPPGFDENKKYPLILSIYGGPSSLSVSNSFGRLSHRWLAQQGIIVLTVDHRGSGHFGKKGEALMHRDLGHWEMHDYRAAIKTLLNQYAFLDETRVGITGGSYGGYATLMGLTEGADCFTHGIAASSVTDWRLYDAIYTERYMDTPEENPEGYQRSSVMPYAQKLRGKLLITHGTLDDNVHMQNSVQLIDEMMMLNKHFEMMIYPNQRHTFRGAMRRYSRRESALFWMRHFFSSANP